MIDIRGRTRRISRAIRHLVGQVGPQTKDEHFVPRDADGLGSSIAAGDTVAVHHLIRYHWAVAALRGQPPSRLIDVACGSGYGSALLAEAFPDAEVIGADYDGRAIAEAQASHRAPNLTFRLGDVQRWRDTLGTEPFDTVVSFDTIEHVPHRDIMMMNVVENLDPDGRLLLSTPSARSTVTLEPSWRFHRIEYSSQALFDLLSRYFRVVQHPGDGSLPALDVFDQLQGSTVSYALRMNPVLCREPIRVPPVGSGRPIGTGRRPST